MTPGWVRAFISPGRQLLYGSDHFQGSSVISCAHTDVVITSRLAFFLDESCALEHSKLKSQRLSHRIVHLCASHSARSGLRPMNWIFLGIILIAFFAAAWEEIGHVAVEGMPTPMEALTT